MSAIVLTAPDAGYNITGWKGDHHYGSAEEDLDQRAYDFPVTVKDANGNPVIGASVTVTTSGQNNDGDVLGVTSSLPRTMVDPKVIPTPQPHP